MSGSKSILCTFYILWILFYVCHPKKLFTREPYPTKPEGWVGGLAKSIKSMVSSTDWQLFTWQAQKNGKLGKPEREKMALGSWNGFPSFTVFVLF